MGVGLSPLYPWILWFLWKVRNLLIFEDRFCTEEDTIHKAIKEAGSWQEAKLHAPPKKKIQKLVDSAAVHQDALLCFSDAAWKSETNMCGLGWIIKDPLKVSLFQGSSSRPYVFSVPVAETLALKAAISGLCLIVYRAFFLPSFDVIGDHLLHKNPHHNLLISSPTKFSRIYVRYFLS